MYLGKIVANSELMLPVDFQALRRRYMTEILLILRKTQSNQSIQAQHNAYIFVIINLISELSRV